MSALDRELLVARSLMPSRCDEVKVEEAMAELEALRAELEQCRADAERFVAMIEAGISEDGGIPNACAKYLTTRRVAAYGSMPKTVDGWRKIIDAARGAK